MGILKDTKVLNEDGTVPDSIWEGFISDIKKKLATGKSTIPGVQIGPPIEPNPAAKLLDLKDTSLYPDFKNVWRPRYEAMVKGIDAAPAYQLSQLLGGAPIYDPTAMATSLGVPPAEPMQLPDALSAMTPAKLPDLIPLTFITNLGDSGLTEVEKTPEMSQEEYDAAVKLKQEQGAAKIIENLAVPPLPPIPPIPDIKNQQLGYSELYSSEIQEAESLLPSWVDGTTTAGPTLVAAILEGVSNPPEMGGKIIQGVGDINSKYSPTQMETSSFEIAVSSTFEEHRAKYTAAVTVGQKIGHGAILDGLMATPFDQGGFEIIREPENLDDEPTNFKDPLSGRRYKILQVIEEYIGDPPNSYVSLLENKGKFEEVTKFNIEEGSDLEGYITAYRARADAASAFDAAPADKKDEKKKELDEATKKLSETKKPDKVATTCNAFPPFVMGKIGWDRRTQNILKLSKFNKELKILGGLDEMRSAARIKGWWVDAMPNGVWDESIGLPKEGDIFLLCKDQKCYPQPPPNAESLKEQGIMPWDLQVQHVGVIFDMTKSYLPDKEGEWILTADAGQGSVAMGDQRVAYVKRQLIRGHMGKRLGLAGEEDWNGKRTIVTLAGWLNVDLIDIPNEISL